MPEQTFLSTLLSKKLFHEEEVKRIEAAIKTYKEYPTAPKPNPIVSTAMPVGVMPSPLQTPQQQTLPHLKRDKIPWTSEIDKSIEPTEVLTIGQFIERMESRGIFEAGDKKNRTIISSILARMASQDLWPIEKAGFGKYTKIAK